jgi:hypothetical protein
MSAANLQTAEAEKTFGERVLSAANGHAGSTNPRFVLPQALATLRTAIETVEATAEGLGDYVITSLIRAADEIDAVSDELCRQYALDREGASPATPVEPRATASLREDVDGSLDTIETKLRAAVADISVEIVDAEQGGEGDHALLAKLRAGLSETLFEVKALRMLTGDSNAEGGAM